MADEIVAVYRAEVEQYKKAVDELVGRLDKLDKEQKQVNDDAQAQFNKGGKAVSGMSAQVTDLTANLKKMAVGLGIAFSAQQVIQFGKEAVKLAASAEGVERAFRRIGSPEILAGLRKATRGTVTDLQLMQNAVKASNFQIPLENLASLFQFAQARARETGESVDYLVDSIILGIGRKSPLILDNLGISAVALREKFNGISAEAATVGDIAKAVGEIATVEMAKMGNQADTTADQLAQLNVVFSNIQKTSGEALIKFGTGLAYILGLLDEADPRMTGFMKALEGIKADRVNDLASGYRDLTDIYKEVDAQLQKVFAIEKELAGLGTSKIDRERRTEIVKFLLPAEKARLDMLREVFEQEQKRIKAGPTVPKEEIRNVFFLTNAIKALNDVIEAEGTSRERVRSALKEIIPLQAELDELLGKQKDNVDKLVRSLDDLVASFEETMNAQMGVINAFYDEQSILATREIASQEERAQVLKEIERARLMEQIQLLQAYGQAATSERLKLAQTEAGLLDDADANYKKFLEGQEADLKDSLERRKKAEEKAEADRQKKMDDALTAINQYGAAAVASIDLISQAQTIASEYELRVLEDQLERGSITRAEYDAERKRIMQQQAEDAKNVAIFQGIINGIVATINAFRDGGPVLAAITAGLVAAQVAIIAAEPVPQFAKGVIGLQGAGTETSDSIPAYLSKGESVMTASETRKYRPILEGIRRGTLDEIIRENYVRPAIDAALLNGFADMGNSAALQDRFNDMNLLKAIDRHRESEVGELRQMNVLLGRFARQPKRGYA